MKRKTRFLSFLPLAAFLLLAAGGVVPAAEKASGGKIRIIGVGFAGEGGFIMVNYKAPPQVARKWYQGTVSVVDENTKAVYNEIPVMPKVGPLHGRPKQDGQSGYVMLVNKPPGLRPGSVVTVVLGDFRQEHVIVKGMGGN